MDKPCDICGDIGEMGAIVSCFECKIAHEHLYCMQQRPDQGEWLCEECKLKNRRAHLASGKKNSAETFMITSVGLRNDNLQFSSPRKIQNDTTRGSFNWEKKMENGKVKFISTEEAAVMLSSALNKSEYLSKIKQRSKTVLSKRPKPLSPGTPSKPNVTQVMHNSIYSCGPLGDSNAQRPDNVHIKPMAHRQVVQLSQERKGGNDRINVDLRKSGAGSSLLMKNLQCDPSLDASWMGGFKVSYDRMRTRLVDGIKAHPPARVRRRIYQFSKKMSKTVDLIFIPRYPLWTSLFPDGPPDQNDIGLYFFPCEVKRPGAYTSLLEFMSEKDLLMQSKMDGVKLLVFTSKVLDADFQSWNGEYFLWGVFCTVGKLSRKDHKDQTILACPSTGDRRSGKQAVEKSTVSSDLEAPSVSRDKDSTCQRSPLDAESDIPPGFEEIKRQRVAVREQNAHLASSRATTPSEETPYCDRVSGRRSWKPGKKSDSPASSVKVKKMNQNS